MEQDTRTDDGHTGELTPKEKFLRCYPSAICIREPKDPNHPYPCYFIEDWCGPGTSIGYALSKRTEEEAWEMAWETAQDMMLSKLEN